MSSKKSQITSQVFIYIIALILFSLILVYGYNAVTGFKKKSETISYLRFRTDLISTINRISPDYGTLKREEFFIGGRYTEVCFVQNYRIEDDDTSAFVYANIGKEIIKNSFRDDANKNVFMFANTLQESIDVGKINVTNGYLCSPVSNGKVKIRFEGKGDHTLISSW